MPPPEDRKNDHGIDDEMDDDREIQAPGSFHDQAANQGARNDDQGSKRTKAPPVKSGAVNQRMKQVGGMWPQSDNQRRL